MNRTSTSASAASALLLVGTLSMAPPAQAADDALLVQQVRTALRQDDSLHGPDVQIASEAGHVHLTGWVYGPADVERAMHDAQAVPGVSTVDSNLHTWASK
ncbi:MAG: hypothetical protein RJA44_2590 [Pseudomonadota bacterium]|jgi:osmotically-inducible protein OsmY